MRLILILLLITTACGQPAYTDSAFEAYVAEFKTDYKEHFISDKALIVYLQDISIKFSYFMDRDAAGMCYIDAISRSITIRPSYWEYASEYERKVLLYHEIGHCLLNRQHSSSFYSDGCPKSIMYYKVLSPTCFRVHEVELLKELFP